MAASEALTRAALKVQQRLRSAWPLMPRRASELHAEIYRCLVQASGAGVLKDGFYDIGRKLKLTPDTRIPDRFLLTGGLVDGTRFGRKDPFRRDDDASVDFSIALRQGPEAVELLAYDFLIDLPPGLGPPFLRFDLNMPEHDNEDRGLRSHVHPGVDEDQMIMPAPVMSPVEILTIFLHHLRRADRERAVRRAFRWDPDAPSAVGDLGRIAFRLMSWVRLNGA